LAAGASWEYQTTLHLKDWSLNFSGTNDWWHTTGTLPSTYTNWSNIPAYVNGVRIWGNQPTPGNSGWLNPSVNAAQTGGDFNGYETSPTNAYSDNSIFAIDVNSGTNLDTSCTSSGKDKHNYYNYNVAIPGTVVDGIEVRLDANADSTFGSPKICVQLSWDGGTTWTTAKSTTTLTTSQATYILGGASDNWGRTWSTSNLSNTNFRVRIIDVAGSTARDFSLDWIAVRVTYH
jgi:hypothetical protein